MKTRKSLRLSLGCQSAEFTQPAVRSCRSSVATYTTSLSPSRRTVMRTSPLHRLQAAGGTGGAASAGAPSNLPKNWHEITQGDLVLAQESLEDGWYEAIVIEANGDMLTLRWRDYSRSRPITRHRHRLGLLFRETKPATGTGKSAKPAPTVKQDKPTAAGESAASPSLPKDWQEINVGHLVLAKDDGPWESWWEAVPIEKAGDGFKLRWRDYTAMPQITRPRIELALSARTLCRNQNSGSKLT